jgi:hypothetical protein
MSFEFMLWHCLYIIVIEVTLKPERWAYSVTLVYCVAALCCGGIHTQIWCG